MEIKYSNYELDYHYFNKDELTGLYEINSNYIYNNLYDIKVLKPSYNIKTKLYLISLNNKNMLNTLTKEIFEDKEEEILNKRLSELSLSELTMVLTIKILLSSSKSVILDHIDSCLNKRELFNLLKIIKNHIKEFDKNIVFASEYPDNLIPTCSNYVIVKDGFVDYAGSDFTKFGKASNLIEFVDLANAKDAKLTYYKDSSDLLKAIYRSVKK